MIWLLKWRQTVWSILLVSLLWSGGLFRVDPAGQEQWAGWWLEEVQQSGYGYQRSKWVTGRVSVPLWVVQGQAWAVLGGWLGLTVGLSWQIWGEGGNLWSCGLLTLASHQVRTGIEGVVSWQCRAADDALMVELVTEMTVSQNEPNGVTTLARRLSANETERQAGLKHTGEAVSPTQEMGRLLAELVVDLPLGTNLGLLQFLWMLVSGNLLESRGAIFPALQRMGLDETDSRRVWAAFAEGKWQIDELLDQWQRQVETEGLWQEHRLGGYRVKAVDLTGFWRPILQNCPSSHYKAEAGKALPAVVLGMVSRVGSLGDQRLPLPTALIRVDPTDPSEATLNRQLLSQVARQLANDEVAVLDAGFNLKDLLAVGLERFVVRQARNATYRRNHLPAYGGRGRPPVWGEMVRPLARSYNGKMIDPTPPDREQNWQIEHKGRPLHLQAQFWDNLVPTNQKPGEANSFSVVAIHDPRYRQPLLLATPLSLDGETLQAIYRDRWPVEQLPLSAKQMIGAVRQFVHAEESIHRLPELALLAGAILSYGAAKLPPIPTGFWDRTPKATPGRLRRFLTGRPFPANLPLPARIRKKASVTDHLPKGILAHRRKKRSI